MTVPVRWGDSQLKDFTGKVRFLRRFGLPRHLDTFERVWLSFEGVADSAEVWLNGELLGSQEGPGDPLTFHVTSILQPRNELRVDVEADGPHGGIWGEVALEIRCSAHLQSIRVQWLDQPAGSQAHLTGAVVGVADRPLDLYLLLDGKTIGYLAIEPQEAGSPFAILSDPVPGTRENVRGQEMRLELVNGGVVWDSLAWPAGEQPPVR